MWAEGAWEGMGGGSVFVQLSEVVVTEAENIVVVENPDEGAVVFPRHHVEYLRCDDLEIKIAAEQRTDGVFVESCDSDSIADCHSAIIITES